MESRILRGEIWDDLELTIEARILCAYFWTNTKVNLIGLYRIYSDYITLATGYNNDLINQVRDELEKNKRVHFCENWVYLPNAQEICGYTVEKTHGKKAIREIGAVPEGVLKHFRLLGHTIPYRYPIDSQLNNKQKIKNIENNTEDINLESRTENEKKDFRAMIQSGIGNPIYRRKG